jgi:hypothetical protein
MSVAFGVGHIADAVVSLGSELSGDGKFPAKQLAGVAMLCCSTAA